jgi:selenoprotein W-related protein
VDAELIGGGGGVFDVTADGKLVFSKHEQGRFPEDDEILSSLEKLAPRGKR